MTFFSSLTEDAGFRHIFGFNPAAGRALLALHTAVLRGPSELSAAERELIVAYVSALNACRYCFGVHAETARVLGMPEATMTALVADLDTAPVSERLRPILRYARKLTVAPTTLTQADADAVFAAGWTEKTLHDAVLCTGLFNLMNRVLEGHGIHGDPSLYSARGKALAEGGYDPLLKSLGG